MEMSKYFPTHFLCVARISLMPKSDKDITKKKTVTHIYHEITCKLLNKIIKTQIQNNVL